MSENSNPLGPAEIKRLFSKINEDIQRDGFTIIWVRPDGQTPSFAYTVGIYQSYQQPEIYTSGLSHSDSMRILWEPVRLMKNGRTFHAGEIATDIFTIRCAFLPIMRKNYPGTFNVTRVYYGHSAFEALQLVIPDEKGRFPWEKDCDPLYIQRQRIIGELTLP